MRKRPLHLLISFLFLIGIPSMGIAQTTQKVDFQTGDLLFQDLDCGPMCKAIESVTRGINGKDFSHVGMVYIRRDSAFVIEATGGGGVSLTPLSKFLNRSKTPKGAYKVVVERLEPEYQNLIPAAVDFALKQIGLPYDGKFRMNNGKYYCSELIYDSFKSANEGSAVFKLFPMTYKNPATGKLMPVWKEYFNKINTPVPQGKPGCNPGGISRDEHLELVHSFY